MINKLFDKQIKSITSAAFIIGIASLFSRLLGLLRDHVLARQFGANDALDAYYAAFRIPDFIYNLLVVGALSAGFIPIFSKFLGQDGNKKVLSLKDKESAWQFANEVTNLLIIIFWLLVLLFLFIQNQY